LLRHLYEDLQSEPFIIAGPCVIESDDICFQIARHLKDVATKHGFKYIFKASFDKANRSSIKSYRGIGIDHANRLFADIKSELKIPILTDIHEVYQVDKVGAVDILQIPSFLSRQTDLLLAAGSTGKIVNIKKGQFMSSEDIANPIAKVLSTNNEKILLTERGTFFGYNNLIVDFRNLIDMQRYNFPVIFDITHSTQRPGSLGDSSGGNPEYAPYFANAAAAIGIRAFFIETHPNPSEALSDGSSMIRLDDIDKVIADIKSYIMVGDSK